MTPGFLFTSIVCVFLQLSTTFYPAFKSTSIEIIDKELSKTVYQNPATLQLKAYRGALLMKKSGYSKGIEQKISLFKEGHELLENAIDAAPTDAEYRFLRLVIQEHAPKILNYNNEIEEDVSVIIEHYSSLNEQLKARIKGYAENSSKALSIGDLK
tara:strand:- start:7374 stop:7841 length:468 start_codon:yes stop_codon:yes gene_type:complete